VYLTFLKAVILILKHATFLTLTKITRELALTHADLDYQEANIDLKIQQHLMSSSQEHSIELLVGFIMATNIGLFILVSVNRISHQVCTESTHLDVLVPSQSSQPSQPLFETHVHRKKDHWFKRVLTHKSIPLPKLRKDK
jgi:hypothetical protein